MQEFSIHHYPSVNSTNIEAVTLAERGAPEGTVIIADEQTAGSGRCGRSWHSPIGNLYCSIILRESYAEIAPISFLAALAVGTALKEIFQKSNSISLIRYKWPNDILVDEKKISGILIQMKTQGRKDLWTVIGIGVNIHKPPPYATSISSHLASLKLSNLELLHVVLQHFSRLKKVWTLKGFTALRSAWVQDAHNLGKVISIKTNRETHIGKFVGISNTGAIILETCGNIINIGYGEVV